MRDSQKLHRDARAIILAWSNDARVALFSQHIDLLAARIALALCEAQGEGLAAVRESFRQLANEGGSSVSQTDDQR